MLESSTMAVSGETQEELAVEAELVEEVERDEAKATRSLWLGLISLGILVLLVVALVLAVPGLHDVGHRIADMWLPDVGLGVVFEILSCLGYVLAFMQVFDRAPLRLAARVALSELAFGTAVSLGGAGSIAIGTLLLTERGAPAGRVVERSAVLFLLTSAINVIVLAVVGLLAWVGILPGTTDPLLTLLPGGISLLVFVGFFALPRICDRFVTDRYTGKIAGGLRNTAKVVADTKHLLFTTDWRLVGAFAFLLADIFVLVLCFAALGKYPPIAVIVLAYQIGYMSNLIPIPGGIGVLDGSFVAMFALFGVGVGEATSATIVYHAISLWVPALWGTIAFILLRRTRKEPLVLRPPRAERKALRAAARNAQT
jgi:uncharacterized membrane protein YbhN (UPF0104 family)